MENDRGVVAGGLPGGWGTRGDGAGSRETEIDGPGWDTASWEGGERETFDTTTSAHSRCGQTFRYLFPY